MKRCRTHLLHYLVFVKYGSGLKHLDTKWFFDSQISCAELRCPRKFRFSHGLLVLMTRLLSAYYL